MATWPASLPPPSIDTLKESPPNNAIGTRMDKGPDKVRRRTTANVRPLAFTLQLTDAELQTLDDFYTTDTFSGVSDFDYTHPRTGAAVTARFKPATPPQYGELAGVLWSVTVELEIMP